jgi:carbonic anhydrase
MRDTVTPGTSCTCCADLLAHRFGRRVLFGMAGAATLAAALPRQAFAAEGQYDALLLNCIDPRFPENTLAYMRKREMVGKYSQFVMAGAAIGVIHPAFKDWAPAFWGNLEVSIALHHIPKVIVVNHRDCGAAKFAFGPDAVKDPATETATHKAALMAFRAEVEKRYQDKLKVETGLMALDGSVEMFA